MRQHCFVQILSCFVVLIVGLGSPVLAQSDSKSNNDEVKAIEDSLKTDTNNTRLMLKLGIIYHNKGASGDKEAVSKAENILKKLIEIDPQNAEAHCWYGSVLTLKGGNAMLPFEKMMHVNNGTKEMDKAVSLAPDNITVRLTRANNSLKLPDFFNRLDTAITDFEYLISMKQKNTETFSDNLLPNIYLSLGIAYKRKGDLNKAGENWKKVLEIAPNTKAAEQAENLIKETEI
jgi:tetratricopeptide (TPR) repeat protein